jgi:hypothetical protein
VEDLIKIPAVLVGILADRFGVFFASFSSRGDLALVLETACNTVLWFAR